MPKRSPAKTGFPRDPENCFESRHLTATQFKVYNVMRACAWSWRKKREGNDATGPLIFTASIKPWLCNAVPMSASYLREVLAELCEAGWLVKLTEDKYRDNGEQEPNDYRVIEHADFLKTHPTSCPPDMYDAHGKKSGDRAELPKNFRKDDDLGRALNKLDAEDGGLLVSDGELAAINKYFAVTGSPDTAQSLPVTGSQVSSDRKSGSAVTGSQVEPCPEVRSESITASVKTSTQHNTTPKPAANADEKAQHVAEEDVCSVLLGMYVKSEGDTPKIVTGKEKAELRKLDAAHGRESFLRAAALWLRDHPWNGATTNPFLTLINKFDGYVAQAKLAAHHKRGDASKKIERELSGNVAALRHFQGVHYKHLFSAEEHSFVKSLDRGGWADNADRIKTLVDDLRKRIREDDTRQTAERAEEQRKLESAISSDDGW